MMTPLTVIILLLVAISHIFPGLLAAIGASAAVNGRKGQAFGHRFALIVKLGSLLPLLVLFSQSPDEFPVGGG